MFVARAREDQHERMKVELADGVIDKAAITAVQLGLSEAEAVKLLKKRFREYSSKSGSGK